MEIVKSNEVKKQDCKHGTGKVYECYGEYYLCGRIDNGGYALTNLRTGAVIEYKTMEELDRENPEDIPVSCHLVIE